ncbi:T9SS type A sorting domain-containing protein [Psychroserpens sp. SPM9]|uniref:T9SS type A sorting domain-containing protein n=1 Tax=Psychroserpens sp. SPM9 TaxID=2975598 RepID=UPI0021A61FA8|nr:T9SS type A sorting domain-containing protein [Psychroserpens sp. SPM9]MDG5492060.1 T9SS type A sorting domain-containing protein [Psychroserpens sp. SPM9]
MKKILFVLSFMCFIAMSWSQEYKNMMMHVEDYTVAQIVEEAEAHFDNVGRGRGTGYKSFRRWQYFAERNMDVTGKTKLPQFYQQELESYNAYLNSSDVLANVLARTTVGTWEEMGPTSWNATSGWNPGVGRITAIAVDPNTPTTMIIGSMTGGVWRSTDGGQTWTVLTDNLSNIDVYALAIDPKNPAVYYWGSTGGTIFRSTNSGSTWNYYSNAGAGIVNKILIDPTANSTKMYATVQGSGIYKSTDSGANWTQIASGNGYDVEFKPGDPNVVYASGTSFYYSNDGGASFIVIPSVGTSGPKMIGVSADDPTVVYVLEASGGGFNNLYKSTNSGISFATLNHTGKNYFGYNSDPTAEDLFGPGQAPRDMDIAVNPTNIDEVHIAGINTWKSNNGGLTFSITSQWQPGISQFENIGYCHADVDILEFVGNKLYVGTDGGIYVANNPSVVNSNFYTDLTGGLGIRQFYKIGVSQTDPVVVSGGSQDNGTSVMTPAGNWIDWLGADGMESFVDKNDSQILYGTSQYGTLYKSVNGGSNLTSISQPDGKGGQSNYNWIVPFEQDPIDANVIYVAFDELYKSTDGGANWTSISTNYSANIDHLKISPVNNNYIYMAINGSFLASLDGGANWFQSPGLSLGGAVITGIAPHPVDASKVAISTSGSEKVYVSTNNGISFTGIEFDLPGFPAQAITYQNNGTDGLYVGMNYGVYYMDNTTGNSWVPFNNGLPNVRINELEINTADDKIYAATYGRGLWRSSVYDASLSVSELELETFKVYPNPAENTVSLEWDKNEAVSVKIYDVMGKLMYFAKDLDVSEPTTIDVSNYTSGLYFVRINNTSGFVTKKLVVK